MHSKFLDVGLQAAKKAETIINHYASQKIRATLKADQSPVTLADQEAESIIIKTIKEAFPDHGFYGEESGATSSQSEFIWIIDPIDGTKNYLRQIPLYATQIALLHNDEVIVGISNAPALNECAYAEKGKGAYLNEKKITVSHLTDLQKAYMSFGGINLFKKHQLLDNLVSLAESVQGRRGIGDFWSYHLLASGKIDMMIEPETKIWDIAAVSLIVQEAGGKVTDRKGQPVTKTTNSLIATNGKLHEQVLQFFS